MPHARRIAFWLPSLRWAGLTPSAYGASDKFHLRFVPNRTCDVADWVADTFGGFLAAAAYWVYETSRSPKTNR